MTAVDPTRAEHLRATWKSLSSQKLPIDWDWEWLVQCDGHDPAAQAVVTRALPKRDARVRFAASRKHGVAVTRTIALARAHGSLIKTLDADDRLTDGALARDIAAHSHTGVGWSASRVINEWPNGRQAEHYPWNPPDGRLPQGTALAAYKNNFRILVHPATLCIKFDLLLALGGWMSLPASEDTALLMALDGCTDGWFNHDPGMLYRRWPAQMSASAAHSDQTELDARRRLATLRGETVAHLIGNLQIEHDAE